MIPEGAPAGDGRRVTATLRLPTSTREKFDITTSTSGIEVGVSTGPLVRAGFDAVPWLGLCTRFNTPKGDPLVVRRRNLVAGSAGGDEDWGSGFDVIDEGARDATTEDSSFDAPVTLGSHKATWTPTASLELLRDIPTFEDELTADAGLGMALLLALWAVNGSGNEQGTGVRRVLAMGAYASRRVQGNSNDGLPTYAELGEMFALVPRSYRMKPSCGWLTSDENWIKLRHEVKDTAGQPILDQNGNIFNRPVYTGPGFPDLAAGANQAIVFGDLASIGLRTVEDMRANSSTAPEWAEDKVSFRFAQSMDTNVIDRRGLSFFNAKS